MAPGGAEAWAVRSKVREDHLDHSNPYFKRNASTSNVSPQLKCRVTPRKEPGIHTYYDKTKSFKGSYSKDDWDARPQSRQEKLVDTYIRRNASTNAIHPKGLHSSFEEPPPTLYLEDDYIEDASSQGSTDRWAWTPRTQTRDEKLVDSFKKRGMSTSNISPQLATRQTPKRHGSRTEEYFEETRERPRSSQDVRSRSFTTGELDMKHEMNYSYPADYPIQPRVVRPQGEEIATLSKGGRMKEYIGTKSEHLSYPPDYPIHPRVVKPEAKGIAELSKGKRMKRLIHEYGHLTPSPRPVPRVKPEAEDIAEGHRGKPVARLLGSYGKLGPATRRVPRIKPEAKEAYEPHKGKRMARIIKQQRTGRSARSESSINNLRLDLEKLNTRDDNGDPFSIQRPKSRDETRTDSFHRRNNTTGW